MRGTFFRGWLAARRAVAAAAGWFVGVAGGDREVTASGDPVVTADYTPTPETNFVIGEATADGKVIHGE